MVAFGGVGWGKDRLERAMWEFSTNILYSVALVCICQTQWRHA